MNDLDGLFDILDRLEEEESIDVDHESSPHGSEWEINPEQGNQ